MPKGLSITFPLQADNANNTLFLYDYTSKASIRSRLYLLLTTEKGERYMYPEYGLPLRKYLFEPNDQKSESDISDIIKEGIKRFMPAIAITSIRFERGENYLEAYIDFAFTESTLSYTDSLSIRYSF